MLSKDDDLKAEWSAYVTRWEIIFGSDGKISGLRTLVNSYPKNAIIRSYFADCLEHLNDFQSAISEYQIAAETSQEPNLRIDCLASIAVLQAKIGDFSNANINLDLIRLPEIAPESDQSLLFNIKRIGEALSDDQMVIEAMEAICHLNPDDYDNRFSLAYAHSEHGNEDLSLYHYLAIPHDRRNQSTWNNLGVAFQKIQLPAKAVAAYTKAAEQGETLAMSNLAYKLMGAGFLELAREHISKAMAATEPHRNVGEAFARLNDIPDEETKSLDEALSDLRAKADFYRDSSQAIQKKNILKLHPYWQAPNCIIKISIEGNKFSAEGEYQIEQNALSSGIFGSKTNKIFKLRMDGIICGRRVFGTIERKSPQNSGLSGLGFSEREKKFLAIFSDDLTSAKVAENINSRKPSFFEIESTKAES